MTLIWKAFVIITSMHESSWYGGLQRPDPGSSPPATGAVVSGC